MAHSSNEGKSYSLASIVKDLRGKTKGLRKLKIDRSKLFDDVAKFLRNLKSSDVYLPDVEFLTDGYCEPAQGPEGPTRELFTLFFQECLRPSRNMFEGDVRRVMPARNEKAVKEKWFVCLGRAIVLSLVSGGSGFSHFAESCYFYFTDAKLFDLLQNLKHDMPTNLMKLISKIDNAKSEEELKRITQTPECTHLRTCIPDTEPMLLKMENKLSFTQEIVQWYLLDVRKDALDQIKEGLQLMDFLQKAKECSNFKHFLVYTPPFCVNGDFIRDKLLPKLSELKEHDNNNKMKIKEMAASCLIGMNDDQAVELFQFITGMRDLPAEDTDISVEFNIKQNEKLPRAVTCENILVLPLGNVDGSEFVTSFKKGLEYNTTFGRI